MLFNPRIKPSLGDNMLGFVIGDNDMVVGFRLVGVEGTEANTPEEAKNALEKVLDRNDVAIVIISQQFSSQPQLREAIDNVRRDRVTPMIVEVPPSRGKPSEINMSEVISKTLGVRM
jgi:vacuolar-type H+-ATPase subunit F/Vma7